MPNKIGCLWRGFAVTLAAVAIGCDDGVSGSGVAVDREPVGAPAHNAPSGDASSAERPIENSDPVEVDLVTLDLAGLKQRIEAHQGTVVVMDVWSLSCIPCLQDFRHLVELHHEYGERIACLSLNIDYTGAKGTNPEDKRSPAVEFLSGQRATFENVLCSEADSLVRKDLRIAAVPAVIVYDQAGNVAGTCREKRDLPPIYVQVRALLEGLLKE